MSGYVKLFRKCLQSAVFADPELWRFWCWCLLKAAYKQRQVFMNGSVINLEPGQFVMGRKTASEDLNISERTVRTCLKNLEKLQNVTSQTTNRFTVVTVMNWAFYQEDEEETTSQTTNKRPTSDQQTTSKRPASDHKQEGLRTKEGKNISYLSDTRSSDAEQCALGDESQSNLNQVQATTTALIELPKSESRAISRARFEREQAELFEQWWKVYPRKQAKKTAFKAWLKIQPSPTIDDVSKLVQIVSVQARTPQWTKDNGEFIPMPATYINQARWTDQVTEISNEPNYGSADW